MNIPIKEFTINPNEDAFVSAIAITATPAIDSFFLTFSNSNEYSTKVEKQNFTANDEKKELLGIAMKADELLDRVDESGNHYKCFFSKSTIRQIAQEFFKKGFANNINIDHTTTSGNAFVFQSFIVDDLKGINSPSGLNAKNGDWIVGLKCNDDESFEKYKSGEFGFSVEGVFKFSKSDQETILNNYYNALKQL